MKHAQYLRNRSYQRRTNFTAYEIFTGTKPDMGSIYSFGAPCFIYTEGPKQKMQPGGQEGIYLGINPTSKSYYLLNQKSSKGITSCNVRILDLPSEEPEYINIPLRKNPEESTNKQSDITDPKIGENEPEASAIEDETQWNARPQCTTGPPKHLSDYYLTASVDYAYSAILNISSTYEEAVQSKDAYKWKAAMNKEINTLTDNKTWDLTPLPENCTVTKGQWVYTLKERALQSTI